MTLFVHMNKMNLFNESKQLTIRHNSFSLDTPVQSNAIKYKKCVKHIYSVLIDAATEVLLSKHDYQGACSSQCRAELVYYCYYTQKWV